MGMVSTHSPTLLRITPLQQALFSQLFDFAGLFPPASQTMADAVSTYLRHAAGPYAWMLHRFVLSTSRFSEWLELLQAPSIATSASQAHSTSRHTWSLSLLSNDWDTERPSIEAACAPHPWIRIASIEQKKIPAASPTLPFYVELPVDSHLTTHLERLPQLGCYAKLRSGGLTPPDFPTSQQVVTFLISCLQSSLAMKATAGLHHPLPGLRPASCLPQAVPCPMHGFVNFILAASVLCREPSATELAISLLEEQDPTQLRFHDHRVEFRDHSISAHDIAHARQRLFHAIGSCSFDEPIADLIELGWLPKLT